ncbi:MAG TPA: hypothetical protein VMV89_05190 [Candidatus Paceibacterota bacterium]|nr:hypothetical protein [Candidatus Paceibacterota bacterium]
MVDERVAATNSQTYRFELPGTVSGGLYTLSFRLDSFTNSSSIAVTNVATGFVGVTQPITLGISNYEQRTDAAIDGGDEFHLPRAKLDESGGLDANGVAVEHKRHGAIYRFRRDQFERAILSGGNAVNFQGLFRKQREFSI